ncbi:hypothetical protein BGZ73_004766 [Actinomortierella ambigua]|nr:hypothetical protein BGZ73_004766 [Actinomortierella ambigua]
MGWAFHLSGRNAGSEMVLAPDCANKRVTIVSMAEPRQEAERGNAAELLSIELSLLLPQDRFLPAREIQAQVWTNVIHKHNPDGPSVWKDIPMSFSHVENLSKNQPLPSHLANLATTSASSAAGEAPTHCIAVFRTHLIPTGRGDFGLTCRWKSHRDQQEWQWATRDETENGEISVRIPRNYASSSSWTLGPQSVLIMTKNGLRIPGVTPSTGPGLYLGNHSAASKAKLSGYDAVLSLVSDILDFDEKIADADESPSKNLWDPVKHQKQVEEMKQQLKEFAQLQEENEALSNAEHNRNRSESGTFSIGSMGRSPSYLGISRRSSVSDLGVHLKSNGDHKQAAPEDDDDKSRLSRKTSVTDTMVRPPSTRHVQSKSSFSSLASADIHLEQPEEEEKQDTSLSKSKPASKASAASKQQQQQAVTTAPASTGKKGKNNKSASKEDVAATAPPASKGTDKPNTAMDTATIMGEQAPVTSPVVNSLAVGSTQQTESKKAAAQAHEASDTNDKVPPTSHIEKSTTQERPPNSGRVLSTIADHAQESNAQYRSRMSSTASAAALTALAESEHAPSSSNGHANGTGEATAKTTKKKPFSHKVIALSAGAHRAIADKDLREAIEFLKQELAQDKKVLVHCRDGNGRSGSVVLAYMVSKCQEPRRVTYDDALKEIWKWKCDVYPHQGLRQSIERHADEWRDL